MELMGREALRERTAVLVAEACAWAVGMSDRLDLRIARSGSFQEALNAIGPDGVVQADRFDADVLEPFVHETCLVAGERARRTRPADWAEMAEDVGEEETDLAAVVAAAGWEAPLRIEAEQLVLAALGAVPLIEVEAEGLPLSLVRAAEAATRSAVPPATPAAGADDGLAAARFLARTALEGAEFTVPVVPADARALVVGLADVGLEPEEISAVLPDLPLATGTIETVLALLTEGTG